MRVRKILLVIICLSILPIFIYPITYTPSNPNVGTVITFRTTNDNYGLTVDWNFGDGTTGSSYASYGEITHYYKNPGTYTVRADENMYGYVHESITITINEDRYISVSPSPYRAGISLTITLVNAKSPPIKWDFGDGVVLGRGRSRTGPSTVTHTYTNPGSYTIRAYDYNGSATVPVTKTISVGNPKKITWTPQTPYVDQEVSFTALYFRSSNIRWDFGDGTVVRGSKKVSHKYKNPGIYTVKAYDYGGDDNFPASAQIQVREDPRKIIVTNPNPGLSEPVVFQALNFFADAVKWDFGDGFKKIGPPVIVHRFRKTGVFKVRVYDYEGNSSKAFETTITVTTKPSHASSLVISGLELFFKNNNKNYLIIPNGATNVVAKARIKYEGTGILNAYWLIDGQPYQLINRVLSFGQYVEFYLEKIPALVVGYHTISIAFYSPKANFENIPELGLFVSPISSYVKLILPYDKESFAVGEDIKFSWRKYPLAMKYSFMIDTSPRILLEGKKVKRVFVNKTEYSVNNRYKEGEKYYWLVEAYDINDNVIARSEVREFKIVRSIATTQEKEREDILSIGENRYLLLSFELTSNQIKSNSYYLVRVFVNSNKANEFVLEGKDLKLIRTSVKIIKGRENIVKLKVYEILKNRLKLISYKVLKI